MNKNNLNNNCNSIKNYNNTHISRSRALDLFDSRVQGHVTHVHP